MDEQEITDARRCGQPKFADLLPQPGQPPRIVSSRSLSMRDIGHGCDPGRDRGLTDIEGPANTVEGIDYVGGPIKPAQPQCGQAVDLRKGPAHDDVVGASYQLDPGFVVVTTHIFGIRGIEDE